MGPPPSPGAAKKTILLMMLGYARGRYLMVRTTSSPDVVDDE
jgi:hypothetical protein